jgi:hypothetical protein
VGLPHRNSSVFKQTLINQRKVKVVEDRRRASEAKGPFPGGKRVGSRGKRKERKKERVREKGVGQPPADLHPPLNKTKVAKAVGGLEGIEKRVG